MLELTGIEFDSVEQIREAVLVKDWSKALNNACTAVLNQSSPSIQEPSVASIYQLDSLVRRSPSLQLTADAKLKEDAHV
jgi:NADH-quinone oxidoreductase subunit G